jgi:sec-independent protein translocase protein TatA
MFLFISGGEIFVILIVVVMVFGADKLPEIARELGKGMRQIKNATNDIKREIHNSAEKNNLDIDVAAKVRSEVSKIKDNFDDFSNPVKKIKTDIEKSLNPLKDADGNLVSYFNKPKEGKNNIKDISADITADSSTTAIDVKNDVAEDSSTQTEEVKNVAEAPSTQTEEVKNIAKNSPAPAKEAKDPEEDDNGTVKREK